MVAILPCPFVCWAFSEEGGSPPPHLNSFPPVTHRVSEGNPDSGAISSWYCKPSSLLLPLASQPPTLSLSSRTGDGRFPLWSCLKGRNSFLWLIKKLKGK